MLTRPAVRMTGTTVERLRTVGLVTSSSSLIMIHRHTARLIVYRSVHNARPQPGERTLPVSTSIRAYHTYTFVYLSFDPAVSYLVCNFARSRAPSVFSSLLACVVTIYIPETVVGYISLITVPDSRPAYSVPQFFAQVIFFTRIFFSKSCLTTHVTLMF